MKNIYSELKWRDLINQVTDESIETKLDEKITLYIGFDPTADSLHIGSLLPIITMKRFEEFGHQNIALVGGATGLIGDPSFKKEERSLNTKEVVESYSDGIKNQLNRFLDKDKTIHTNNYDWIGQVSAIDFLRDYGKDYNVSYMLNKESVSSRIESGLSFTEFSYTILQGLDFNHLYQNYNCELQLGGSDQWGNITSGLEAIRKNNQDAKAYGLTIPLVTKSDGTKFGKTESGTIWLDKTKTTPYEFYQFFFNSLDADVIKYLKYFTFLSKEEIYKLEVSLKEEPFKRLAQKTLSEEVTKFVHGEDALNEALKVSETLFSGDLSLLTKEEIEANFSNMKMYEVKNKTSILDALIESELASSKREGREFLANNSISINGEKIQDEESLITHEKAIGNTYVMVKRGKKKYSFIKVV